MSPSCCPPPPCEVSICVYKLKVASVVSVGPRHLAKMLWACSLPQGGTRLPAASFPLGLYGLGQVGPLDWTTYLSRGGGGRRGRFLPLVPHSILATDQMKMQFFPASHFFKATSAAYHAHIRIIPCAFLSIWWGNSSRSVHFRSISCDFRRSLRGSARSCAEIPQGQMRKLASIWNIW